MTNRELLVAVLAIGLLTLGAMALAKADMGRRYDADNKFSGSYRTDPNGTIRLYDENGAFEGTVRPDGRGYRRYDWNNRFDGSVDEEGSSEDE